MLDKIKKFIKFLRDWRNQFRYFKWMTQRTKPYFWRLMLVLGFDLTSIAIGVGSAVVNKYVIDGATGGGDYINYLWLMVLLTVVSIALGAVSQLISTYINEAYAFSIRSKVFDGMLKSDWQRVSAFHSGDLMTRMTSDVDTVSGGIASILPNLISLVVRLVAAFFVLFHYDSMLAMIALIIGPVGAVASLFFSGKLKRYQDKLRDNESRYRSFLQEATANISVVKAFEREDACDEKLLNLRNERLKTMLERNKYSTIMRVCMQSIFSLSYITAFGWGAYRLSQGEITYGTMTVFLSLVSQIQSPIMGLTQLIPQFIGVLSSTSRVMEIDEIEPEARGESGFTPPVAGVRLQNVSFKYDRELVLRDVNVTIEPGDVVGIVGYSGVGKTTLIRLILALTRPEAGGRVTLFDGRGFEEAASASSRRMIGYVPQGNTLISGTIRDNLLDGKGDATEEEMIAALKISRAWDFVEKLPDGLDTHLMERAAGLSEGQAQRIAIARAVIRDAAITIFDEATSALDADTEMELLKGLLGRGGTKTMIIITHRRSMLNYCTRAFEMRQDEMLEIPAGGER